MREFPSAKEFWDDSRNELQYTEVDYVKKEFLPNWSIHDNHQYACDKLSRQIAVETGQAKEHALGIIEYKKPHIYFVDGEKHEAKIGDKWNAEICR